MYIVESKADVQGPTGSCKDIVDNNHFDCIYLAHSLLNYLMCFLQQIYCTERLATLDLLSLEFRRNISDLVFLFKHKSGTTWTSLLESWSALTRVKFLNCG